jgi:hypothetical protein
MRTLDASSNDSAYCVSTRRRYEQDLGGAYGGVGDLRVDAATPSGHEETEGVAGKQEDAVDKSPFFRFDPVVVSEVVGVVEERVERCASAPVWSCGSWSASAGGMVLEVD